MTVMKSNCQSGCLFPGEFNRAPVNPFRGVPLGLLLDAGLCLGQPGDLTASRPNPAIYLGPAYWAELQRRNALLAGRTANLGNYRREQPASTRCPSSRHHRKAARQTPPGTGGGPGPDIVAVAL
jgi:hypothetical protein